MRTATAILIALYSPRRLRRRHRQRSFALARKQHWRLHRRYWVERPTIDPPRIYATGCSAGGLMAGVMALHRSSLRRGSRAEFGRHRGPLFALDRIEDPDRVPAVITMHEPPETDTVFTAFQDSSRTLNQVISRAGGFAINCNHGGGHCGAPAEHSWPHGGS